MLNENGPDFDEDEEVTDNGLGNIFRRLKMGDYNDIEALDLIRRGRALAQRDELQLLELRRTLLSIFGTSVGDVNQVVLIFGDGRNGAVTLLV